MSRRISARRRGSRPGVAAQVAAQADEGDHWKAAHGSIVKTMFEGFITGEDSLREVLDVKFVDLGGSVQVDLHRPIFQPGAGDNDGLVQMRLYDAYKAAVGTVAADLQQRGILVTSRL